MRFASLGSGSAGNALLVQAGRGPDRTALLIDCGFGPRELARRRAALGSDSVPIDALLVTHEHGDHSAGLSGLKKYPQLKVFANAATAEDMRRAIGIYQAGWNELNQGNRACK